MSTCEGAGTVIAAHAPTLPEVRAQGNSGSEPPLWRWLLHMREAEAAGEPVPDV
jgi:hypothetical protein